MLIIRQDIWSQFRDFVWGVTPFCAKCVNFGIFLSHQLLHLFRFELVEFIVLVFRYATFFLLHFCSDYS